MTPVTALKLFVNNCGPGKLAPTDVGGYKFYGDPAIVNL